MMASKQNDYIFYGDSQATLSDMSLLMLLRRMVGTTLHQAFAHVPDWVAEQPTAHRQSLRWHLHIVW